MQANKSSNKIRGEGMVIDGKASGALGNSVKVSNWISKITR